MILNEKFLTQSGASSFHFSHSPINTIDDWRLSIGTSGFSEFALDFSGVSGRIFDGDGFFLSCYGQSQIDIKVYNKTGAYFVYCNSVPVKGALKEFYDLNYVYFSGRGDSIPQITVSGDSDVFENSVGLFITKDQSGDQSWIDVFNHLYDEELVITSSFTGQEISGNVSTLSDTYNTIIFGQSLESGDIDLANYWSGVTCAKILLNTDIMGDLDIGYVTGEIGSNSSGVMNDGDFLNFKVCGSGENFLANNTTGNISLFSNSGNPLINYFGIPSGPLLTEYNSGESGSFSGGYYYVFNLPSGITGVTDDLRQSVINLVRELI